MVAAIAATHVLQQGKPKFVSVFLCGLMCCNLILQCGVFHTTSISISPSISSRHGHNVRSKA